MKIRTTLPKKTRGHKPAWDKEAARKKLDELALEQGLGDRIPDYAAIASEIWPTRKDVADFDQWFREVRRKGTAVTDIDD